MRTISIVILTVIGVFAALGLGGYLYLKAHTFTAREKPPEFESTLAGIVRRVSARPEPIAEHSPIPSTPEALEEGMHHYAAMCVVCHGPDGRGETETGEGLYPPVPNLQSEDTQRMTDGDLYNVIKNGIPFSGMPAWDEEEPTYWKIVQFVRHLPKITQEEIENVKTMSRESEGDEHGQE